MLILIIIGLFGFIFSLSLILYFTSKDVIGEPKEYDKLGGEDKLDMLDAGSGNKATQQDSTQTKDLHQWMNAGL